MKPSLLGKRHLMVFLGFLIYINLGILRQGMAVAIVSMVNHTECLENTTGSFLTSSDSLPTTFENSTHLDVSALEKLPGQFKWSTQLQGIILSASFYGYMVTNLLSGRLAEVYGAKITIAFGGIVAGLSTLLSPAAAWWNVNAFIAAQFARGLGQGCTAAPQFELAARWIPPKERGLMNTLMVSGLSVGCLVGALAVGKICDTPGLQWPASFYLTGGFNVVIVLIFAFLFYEKPEMHPHLSQEELKYITEDQESDALKERPSVPWKRMFTSVPMHALFAGLLGNFWSFTYFTSVHATFLGVVIKYSMTMVGILSSVPFMALFFGTIISSILSMYITSRDILSTNTVRKGCAAICGLGFSASFLGLIYFGYDKIFNIVAVVVAQFSMGIGMSGPSVVAGDMSPVFAGTVFSVTSTFAYLVASSIPVIVGMITKHETFDEWQYIFCINIGVSMFATIIFLLFGSAEIQPWNTAETNEEDLRNTENQYTSTDCILKADTSVHM